MSIVDIPKAYVLELHLPSHYHMTLRFLCTLPYFKDDKGASIIHSFTRSFIHSFVHFIFRISICR